MTRKLLKVSKIFTKMQICVHCKKIDFTKKIIYLHEQWPLSHRLFAFDIIDYNLSSFIQNEFSQVPQNVFEFCYNLQNATTNNFSSFVHNFCLEPSIFANYCDFTSFFGKWYWLCLQQLFIPNNEETCKLSKSIFSKHWNLWK